MARERFLVVLGIVAGALVLTLAGCGASGDNAPEAATNQADETQEGANPSAAAEEEAGAWVLVESSSQSDTYPNETVTYTIDEQGNVIERHRTYDGDDASQNSVDVFENDEHGWVTSVTHTQPDMDLVIKQTYTNELDDEGRVTRRTYQAEGSEATVTEMTYGPKGYLASLTQYRPDGEVDRAYTYDEDGKLVLIEIAGEEAHGVTPANDPQTITIEYTYDEKGNVSSSTATYDIGYSVVNEFQCDENGNMVARTMTTKPLNGDSDVVSYEYKYEYVENPSPAAFISAHEFAYWYYE